MPVPTKHLFADFSNGEVHAYLVAARNAAGGQTPVHAVNDIPENLRTLAKRLARVHADSQGSMRISVTVEEEALQIPGWARLVGSDIPNDAPARSRIEDALRDKGDVFLARDPALSDMLEIWRSQEGLHSTFPGWLAPCNSSSVCGSRMARSTCFGATGRAIGCAWSSPMRRLHLP